MMNSRLLNDLAEEAKISYILVPANPYIKEDLAKFAELIVLECCDILNQEALLTAHVPAKVNKLISERLKSVFIKIENRFGIK
jgi:hypothetical protein